MPKNERSCGVYDNSQEFNHSVSTPRGGEVPKPAATSQASAVLGNAEDYCGAQDDSPPKTATPFCRDTVSHPMGPQNTVDTESYVTSGFATAGFTLGPVCCECGAAIIEPAKMWWGGEPCHRECGEAAWRREWKGQSSSKGLG